MIYESQEPWIYGRYISSGVRVGVGVGVGIGIVGFKDCPVLYWDIRSLLLIARTGEKRIVRITRIPRTIPQVFMLIKGAFV